MSDSGMPAALQFAVMNAIKATLRNCRKKVQISASTGEIVSSGVDDWIQWFGNYQTSKERSFWLEISNLYFHVISSRWRVDANYVISKKTKSKALAKMPPQLEPLVSIHWRRGLFSTRLLSALCFMPFKFEFRLCTFNCMTVVNGKSVDVSRNRLLWVVDMRYAETYQTTMHSWPSNNLSGNQ